jgi:ankyrin repeat protein
LGLFYLIIQPKELIGDLHMNEASVQLLDLLKHDWPHDINDVQEFLNRGADVNAFDAEGNTPLLLELIPYLWSNKDIIKLLCNNGADINHRNQRRQNALMLAVRKSPGVIFKGNYLNPLNKFSTWLVKEGVDISATDLDGNSVIHYAYGNKKILELLIKTGVSIDQLNNKKQNLLHVPTGVYLSIDLRNNPEYGGIAAATLKWLLSQGVDPNARDIAGQISLHAVTRIDAYNPRKAAKILIEGGADPSSVDATGTSLSDFHLHEGDLKLAKWFTTAISEHASEQLLAKESNTQVAAKNETSVKMKSVPVTSKKKTVHETPPKVTKEIESQRQSINEALAILQPIFDDPSVRDSTKDRIRFVLDVSQPSYLYSLKETSPDEMSRLANMVGGWPYTSQKYPWPMQGNSPFPPFLQLSLKEISILSNTNLGDGFLQIWATHRSSLIRVIDHADTQTAPSEEYFDTGILGIGEEDSHFDNIEFDKMPHARRSSIINAGRPKPTVIPYFEPDDIYGLDDEGLSGDYHKLIDKAIKLVRKYFAQYYSKNLFGAQRFIQHGYGSYIDMCVNEGWRPLMCFKSDDCNFEFNYDGCGYLLYRIVDLKPEFFFFWAR